MTKLTISEMKKINKEKGGHWFSKGTMKFFNTRIEAQPNKDNIFITSEYMDDPRDKKYSLRQFIMETGDIETLSGFNDFDSLEKARIARKLYNPDALNMIKEIQPN